MGPFAGLDETALRTLAPRGITRSFAKNCVVINEGDTTDTLYVVLSGRVRVFVSDEDGREVVFDKIGAGGYFGELVLDGGARSASVMTLERSRFYIIPRSEIEGLLAGRPAFARALIDQLIRRVRVLSEKVRVLALRNVYGRLVRFLAENAIDHDGQQVVRERLTQNEIAARIGCGREMVNRTIKDLTAAGYITVEARQIIIHKIPPANW